MNELKRPQTEITCKDSTPPPPISEIQIKRPSGVYETVQKHPNDKSSEIETLELIERAIQQIINETNRTLQIANPIILNSTQMSPVTEYQRVEIEPLLEEIQTPINKVLEICNSIREIIKKSTISNAQIYGKTQIANRIVHDLNNKIAAIKPTIDFLTKFFDKVKNKKYVTKQDLLEAKEDIWAILQITVKTLEIAISGQNSIKSNEVEPDTIFDIQSSIDRASSSLSRQSRFKITHKNYIKTTGRLSELESLFFNVIQNAVKFSKDPNSTIAITTTKKDQRAVITVKNEGPQIQGNIEQIFKNGHRDSNAKTIPGTGAGLAICREICNQHDGTITATNHNTGITVTITIPLRTNNTTFLTSKKKKDIADQKMII